MKPRSHAHIGPSSVNRYLSCPASAASGIAETTDAHEGTEVHAEAERRHLSGADDPLPIETTGAGA